VAAAEVGVEAAAAVAVAVAVAVPARAEVLLVQAAVTVAAVVMGSGLATVRLPVADTEPVLAPAVADTASGPTLVVAPSTSVPASAPACLATPGLALVVLQASAPTRLATPGLAPALTATVQFTAAIPVQQPRRWVR